MALVASSILAADHSRLAEAARKVEECGSDWLHVDVMDGSFVPQLTFGNGTVATLRKETSLFLDVHLMIQKPERHIEDFAKAGADLITVHAEATEDLVGTVRRIKAFGKKAGVAIKPGTSIDSIPLEALEEADLILVMTVEPGLGGQKLIPETLSKVREARKLFGEKFIEVDGGINHETAQMAVQAGASVLVAGTAVFGSQDVSKAISLLRGVPA